MRRKLRTSLCRKKEVFGAGVYKKDLSQEREEKEFLMPYLKGKDREFLNLSESYSLKPIAQSPKEGCDLEGNRS